MWQIELSGDLIIEKAIVAEVINDRESSTRERERETKSERERTAGGLYPKPSKERGRERYGQREKGGAAPQAGQLFNNFFQARTNARR